MLVLALAICAVGVLQIYSATHDTLDYKSAWWKQILFIALGLLAMWMISSVDYHTLLGQVPLLYLAAIAGLILVMIVGVEKNGGRRWIPLFGGFLLQVSEFVKLVIILLVARYLTDLKSDQLEGRDLWKLGGLVALPLVMVLRQPDLGTSLTYLPVFAAGIFFGGLNWRHGVILAVLAVAGSFLAWHFVLEDFQKARLVSFRDPELDPRGSGYQVIQSKIAVGSGGMWGRGVTRGTQTQLRFLPVGQADFIFATFGEENGFVGVVFGLGLYFLLVMQIVQNAQTAPDRAGMFLCMGVAAILLFHLLVNVGMVVGQMPITGIPLPLMSSGGSSTLSIFMMLGLVNNVRSRRFVN